MSFWSAQGQSAVNISFEFDDELPSFELKGKTHPKRFDGKNEDELDIKMKNPECDFDISLGELSLKKKRPPSTIVKPAFEIFAKLQRNIDDGNLEEFNENLNALAITVDPLIDQDSLLQQAIKSSRIKNNNRMVSALLEKGANPNLLNINFETALDTFIQTIKPLDDSQQVSQQRFNDFYTRFFEILSLLIKHNARCFIKRVVAEGKSSEPPLHSLVGNTNMTLTLDGKNIVHKFVSDYLSNLNADVARNVVNAQVVVMDIRCYTWLQDIVQLRWLSVY